MWNRRTFQGALPITNLSHFSYMLYSKRVTKLGAWVGMLSGGLISALWPLINPFLPVPIEPLLPAFIISFGLTWGISYKLTSERSVQESTI